ncbi:ferredoxin [Aeromicrobium sp. YIM 150415]|uniref:ferredoxin n=1 Tax=Aeromicrobium sp. YIM 150415 TaxID=2803912 RepID=UPI001962E741|nr:ferredoxin [Aeromicrobium sp. YIM 150415]MBM9464076.1 ferredoxin [Aeromicrobium sp. YIM 150415]
MRFRVDLEQCENHGQCAFAAPDLFSLDDTGLLALRQEATREFVSDPLPEAESRGIAMAIDMCPMQAISETE